MYPSSIQKLITLFSKFPAIGQRTAGRFVFYLLETPKKDVDELIQAIKDLRDQVGLCSSCFNPYEKNAESLCEICKDPRRDKETLCIVEKETDLAAIEKTKQYKGLYFILGGTVGTLKKEEISSLRIEELKKRLSDNSFKEAIIATNPTTEGDATAIYLKKVLESFKLKATKLGRGLPTGAEVEYADEETLKSALEGRK